MVLIINGIRFAFALTYLITMMVDMNYGEFQNVFLSGEECSQLETAYPGKAAEYIERLSRYMASNDRHYANHYATIKKWLNEDSKGRSAKNYTYDDNEGECL